MAVSLAAVMFAAAPFTLALEADLGLTWLFRMRGPRPAPSHVAVVAIDHESAQALGQSDKISAWPRSLHARLIDALARAKARVVVFDVSFAAPRRDPADDLALADALARAKNVVLLDALERTEPAGTDAVIERRLPPLPLFAKVAAAHGPFLLPKAERVHAYWLFKPSAGGAATLPALAAQIYDLDAPESAARLELGVREESRYLDFYGPPRSVPTVGFHQVLLAAEQGAEGAAWLRETFDGRAVFVGYSAAEPAEQDRVRDDYPTVFTRADGLNLSGVEIAATAFANLSEGRSPQPLLPSSQIALLLGWGLLLCLISAKLRGGHAVLATGAICLVYLALAHICFVSTALWLPLVSPLLLQAPLTLLIGLRWHYLNEQRERTRLGSLIKDMLPPAVVEKLLGHIRTIGPSEETTFGIFVMTDIQGFTSIAESLAPAEATRMLNDYFAQIFPAVENNGGSVAQIDGDGMLAVWLDAGPLQRARAAACQAALEIAELTRGGNAHPGWPLMPTRIGIHGGPIALARVGASLHHEYRLVGDAANTASRIEALSKHLGTKLLVSASVVEGLDDLLIRPLGSFMLAGKSAPVLVCELLGHSSVATARQLQLCAAFADAREAYALRHWQEAAVRFSEILQSFPEDGPSRFYLQLATRDATDPPPDDWDGIIRMATK